MGLFSWFTKSVKPSFGDLIRATELKDIHFLTDRIEASISKDHPGMVALYFKVFEEADSLRSNPLLGRNILISKYCKISIGDVIAESRIVAKEWDDTFTDYSIAWRLKSLKVTEDFGVDIIIYNNDIEKEINISSDKVILRETFMHKIEGLEASTKYYAQSLKIDQEKVYINEKELMTDVDMNNIYYLDHINGKYNYKGLVSFTGMVVEYEEKGIKKAYAKFEPVNEDSIIIFKDGFLWVYNGILDEADNYLKYIFGDISRIINTEMGCRVETKPLNILSLAAYNKNLSKDQNCILFSNDTNSSRIKTILIENELFQSIKKSAEE